MLQSSSSRFSLKCLIDEDQNSQMLIQVITNRSIKEDEEDEKEEDKKKRGRSSSLSEDKSCSILKFFSISFWEFILFEKLIKVNDRDASENECLYFIKWANRRRKKTV